MVGSKPRCCRRSWLLALAVLAATTGCTPYARHQVLTFFFTGVPPLGGAAEQRQPAAAAVGALTRQRQLAARQAKPFTGPYLHGPYAAGDCAQCHEMSDSVGFGINGSQDAQQSIVPGRFVLPPEQLCVVCHAGKSAAAVQAAGLWLHGPAWNCTACHSPHDGQDPYFLRAPVKQLCRQCHAEGYIHDTDLHAGAEECLDCHNPHMGRDSRMLRDDFQESY